jgi:hypothetical protein
MAGEARGKALESIVVYAMRSWKSPPWPSTSQVVWDGAVDGLVWKPDVFVPPSGKFNGFSVWITFAGSENDSQQKFWRNLAELFDAVEVFPSISSLSVIAGGRIRGKMLETQQHIFKGVLEMESLISSSALRKLLERLSRSGLDREERLALVEQSAERDDDVKKLLLGLQEHIASSISATAALHPSFWTPVSKVVSELPEPKITHFRRGIAKASLLTPTERALVNAGKRLPPAPHHEGLLMAGILGKSLGGNVLRDDEIRFAVNSVADLDLVIEEGLTKVGIASQMRVWNLGVLRTAIEWCNENWGTIASPKQLSRVFSGTVDCAPRPNTLLQALKAILAIRLGRQGQAWLEDVEDSSGIVKSVLIGLIIPKFERGEMALPATVEDAIVNALSSRCKQVAALDPKEVESSLAGFVKKEIETALVCHGIDGVGAVIETAMKKAGIPFSKGRLRSGLAERLGYAERDLSLSTGCVAGTSTFIHWRTVSESGREHKLKELSSRVFQSRRQWDGEKYIVRSHPRKCVLVVDGEWRAGDFEVLRRFGWDDILYPDQMDKLIAAIV